MACESSNIAIAPASNATRMRHVPVTADPNVPTVTQQVNHLQKSGYGLGPGGLAQVPSCSLVVDDGRVSHSHPRRVGRHGRSETERPRARLLPPTR